MPGFLPASRASLMLDLVVCAMVLVVPLLLWSIRLVRRGHYRTHKRIQIGTAAALLLALAVFEIDIRLHGWRHLAEASRFYDSLVFPALWLHLPIAIATLLLWIWTLVGALRHFPSPPAPGPYSPRHRVLGRLSAAGMILTALTGWAFYILAFVC